MPAKYLLLLLWLFTPALTFAQQQEQKEIDRELKRLGTNLNSAAQIKLLDSIAYNYKTINPDSGLKYARRELDVSLKVDFKEGIALANSSMGLNYQYKSDYPQALECFFVALAINEKIGKAYNIASNCNNIGVIYQAQNNLPKALEYYLRALKMDREQNNTSSLGGDLGNIGTIYMSLNDFPKALDYDLQSMAIFRQLGDSDGVAHNLGNIGNVYKVQRQYVQALDFDTRALAIFEAEGDKSSTELNLGNIGGIYLEVAKDSTDTITRGNRIPASRTVCISRAIDYLARSVALSKELGQFQDIMEFNQALSDAYALNGDYKKALDAYKQYTIAKDSVFSGDDKERIAQLSIQRSQEVKNKQVKIDQLEVDHRRSRDELALVCLALALLSVGIIIKKFFPRLL